MGFLACPDSLERLPHRGMGFLACPDSLERLPHRGMGFLACPGSLERLPHRGMGFLACPDSLERLPHRQKKKGVGGGNRHPSLTRRQKDRLTSWGVVCQPVNAITQFVYIFTEQYTLKLQICQLWL
jgi:hypothetical protein